MGNEFWTVLDYLDNVWQRAQFAWRERQGVAEAMAHARRAGATDDQISEASGLSVAAVDSYIRQYQRRGRSRSPDESLSVGVRPPRRRTRGEAPRF